MAKTYKEWEDEAKKSGLYDTFDQADLDRAKVDVNYGYTQLERKKQYVNSTDEKEKSALASSQQADRESFDKAHSLGTLSTPKSGVTQPAQSMSKYSSVNRLLSEIAGDKFSYNPAEDKRYKLAEEYAQQAMANQIAESALLTGGYGNSYAAAAGQRVYNDYMNNAVNDMEDRAYQKWAAERDNKYNLLGIVQGLEEQEYNRAQTERQWQYQEDQDTKKAESDARTDARSIVYDHIQNDGNIADLSPELVAATGWSDAYINSMITKKQTIDSEANAKSMRDTYDSQIEMLLESGGKVSDIPSAILAGSSYANNIPLLNQLQTYYAEAKKSKQGEEKPILSLKEALDAYEDGNHSSNVIAALKYYYGDDFEGNMQRANDDTIYTDAMNYLALEKVSPAYTGLLVSPYEFEIEVRKYGRATVALGDRQVSFSSYDDYVDAFVDEYKNKKAPTNGDGVTILSPSQFEAKKRGGSVSMHGQVFDNYEDYKRYMEEEYGQEVVW